MKVLFLSRWFPYPPNNGSKLRIYNLLCGLAQQHEVTLLSFADQPQVNPEAPELRSLCREARVVHWKPYNPNSRRALLGFLSLTPRLVLDTFLLRNESSLHIKYSGRLLLAHFVLRLS